VLVTGESGTGKELVARVIHDLDARPRKGNLVVLDCTTIVPTLSGSEFFGHERGAFTGADTPREGAFALADGGTLFLVARGYTNREIASALVISVKTASVHVSHILRKLDAPNRREAAAIVHRLAPASPARPSGSAR
jgi:DNA-binding NtrC family response regulator